MKRTMVVGLLVGLESVSDARLSDDEPRTDRVRLKLASQAANMNSQVLLSISVRLRPNRRKKLPMRKSPATVLRQRSEKFPLCLREVNRRFVADENGLDEVDDQPVDLEWSIQARDGRLPRSAQLGSGTSLKLDCAERLGDVIIRPDVEQLHLFLIGMARRKNDDRRRRRFPDLTANIDAANIGKSEIENDQCRLLCGSDFQAFPTGRSFHHAGDFALEGAPDDASNLRLVVNHQREIVLHCDLPLFHRNWYQKDGLDVTRMFGLAEIWNCRRI